MVHAIWAPAEETPFTPQHTLGTRAPRRASSSHTPLSAMACAQFLVFLSMVVATTFAIDDGTCASSPECPTSNDVAEETVDSLLQHDVTSHENLAPAVRGPVRPHDVRPRAPSSPRRDDKAEGPGRHEDVLEGHLQTQQAAAKKDTCTGENQFCAAGVSCCCCDGLVCIRGWCDRIDNYL